MRRHFGDGANLFGHGRPHELDRLGRGVALDFIFQPTVQIDGDLRPVARVAAVDELADNARRLADGPAQVVVGQPVGRRVLLDRLGHGQGLFLGHLRRIVAGGSYRP